MDLRKLFKGTNLSWDKLCSVYYASCVLMPSSWKVGVIAGALATFLYYRMTLKMKAVAKGGGDKNGRTWVFHYTAVLVFFHYYNKMQQVG